jgi:hypothetical protein
MQVTTPPWKVDAWDLTTDLRKIEQQWASVREILGDPTRAEVRHDATSGWGCGEHAGHAVIAAFGIARGIERALADPERDRHETAAKQAAAILRGGLFPRGVAKAPERLDPTRRTREEMLAVVEPATAAWSSLGPRANEIARSPARFPHFVLGHLTGGEWVRFCAIHTAHHLTLVREIEAAAGVAGRP